MDLPRLLSTNPGQWVQVTPMTWGAPMRSLCEGAVEVAVEAGNLVEGMPVTIEGDHTETLLGHTLGDNLNMGPGRATVIHVASVGINLLNVGSKTLKAARRWVLGVAWESKFVT
jgi:hypothetical protein